ncbi:MAG: IS30 family transposase, partial [Oscillospiraceae bacterium]
TRDAMIRLLGRLPSDKLKSITPDRGSEFALYLDISAAFDNIPFYFADPHPPWQRGTNENTNGLIRECLPKDFDMACVSDKDIAGFITTLNLRPRKCLEWHSPLEVFCDMLLHLT